MTDENSANKFIKAVAEWDKDMVYKATTIDGKIFKSKGYDNAKVEFDKREFRQFNNQIKRTRF